jgi:Icc-related predicted phosphoesterase|tara:strand:- start:53 stop:814 length:762 start_codon:yes stop_codon:yes gene_type:complete
MKVVAIGDLHDSPNIRDKSRFRWIAKHIKKVKPDVVVQIGDIITLDSCTHYISDDTYTARIEKPTFMKEMQSFDEALEEFHYVLKGEKIKKYITLGNHEKRMWRYEDKNPTFYGMCQKEFFGTCRKYKWKVIPWGQYLMLGGVGFIHAPINPMGKEYGGEASERQIANKSKIDIVFGHSHRAQDIRVPKISDTKNDFTRILNIGCALPEGHIESYAKHSLTGWTYQIVEIDIWDNHIMEVQNISMKKLKKLYG